MVRSDPIGRTLRCQGAAEKGLLDIFGIQTHSDKTLRGTKIQETPWAPYQCSAMSFLVCKHPARSSPIPSYSMVKEPS